MSLLSSPDPEWPARAADEIARWRASVAGLVTVHHIGSTSIPGLPAKPIIDLLPVFTDEAARNGAAEAVQAMGYEWMGEHGLPGRVYARLIDRETAIRRFHAHGYVQDHPDIRRHLAFRNALRDNAALRAAYTSVKAACAARHPEGGADYGACKSGWIDKAERRALERMT